MKGTPMKSRFLFALLLVVIALPLSATNGYFTHGQGTTTKAMAGAGSALPQDGLAGVTNPAAIVYVEPQLFASLAFFNPNRSYTISGAPSGYAQTFGLTPGKVESESEIFFMPSLAANWKIGQNGAFSTSFVSHGGMNTDYRTGTFYGGSHTGVDLAQAFLNATYAQKLSENHSVGISAIFAFQRFEAQGLRAFSSFSSDPGSLTNNAHDNSYGYGLKVGYLGKLSPRFSVAASYSPKLDMSEFDDYAGLFCDSGDFDIPASSQIGVAWKVRPDFTVAADVQRIEYSGVDAIAHTMFPNFSNGLGSSMGPGFGWRDINVYKIGGQWDVSRDWTVRAGYSKGDQPIRSSEVMFNILAPGVIEEHLTAGFSREVRGGNRVNVALMYALENSVTGANPMEAPGAQSIELTMDEWELEIGYSLRF
jgi:long-chain fatty acid transport protein